MKTCRQCGAQGPETLASCARCRAPFTSPAGRRTAPVVRAQDPPGAAGLLLEPWLWQPSAIGRHQPRTTGRREAHFLVPPFGEPIRLEALPGSSLVLGRDEDCDVCMSSPNVSRRHAEITFRGTPPRAYVRDLGTVNGTRLNGALVVGERTLEDRDVLKLGEVTAAYRVLRPSDVAAAHVEPRATPERLNATIPLAAEAGHAPPSGLSGDIQFVPLEDVLGKLTIVRATGLFVVEVDGALGHVRFEAGRALDARFGDREGDVAVRTISALKRGRFRFEARGEPAATGSRPGP